MRKQTAIIEIAKKSGKYSLKLSSRGDASYLHSKNFKGAKTYFSFAELIDNLPYDYSWYLRGVEVRIDENSSEQIPLDEQRAIVSVVRGLERAVDNAFALGVQKQKVYQTSKQEKK